ncbi:hypothetical protein [Kineococcus sp. SYSU DK003]|uniref:hypothetical protein n=1 Tax=Kineococcus sp. SYSU DK003 TaxID=3383124 RepID=UPI003D7DE14F
MVPSRRLLSALALAVVFGTLNAFLDGAAAAPLRFAGVVLNAGFAWAGLAVAAGAVVRTPRLAVVAGGLAATVGLSAFYVVDALVRDVPVSSAGDGAVFWFAAGLLLCPALGFAGSQIRRPGVRGLLPGVRGLLAALVVPVGAAVEVVVLPPGPDPVRWTVGSAAVLAVAAVLRAHRRREVSPAPG